MALTAKGRSTRVVLNRRKVDGVRLAVADGVHEVAKAIVTEATPPDATPFGEGLVTTGGTLVYVGTKKVDGFGLDGRQPPKPRAAKLGRYGVISAFAGFGFPGRFQEFGTVHHDAQPFLTPSMNRVLPRAGRIIARAAKYRIARLGR